MLVRQKYRFGSHQNEKKSDDTSATALRPDLGEAEAVQTIKNIIWILVIRLKASKQGRAEFFPRFGVLAISDILACCDWISASTGYIHNNHKPSCLPLL